MALDAASARYGLRTDAAIMAAGVARQLSRRTGRGATSLPGRVFLAIVSAPAAEALARRPRRSVLVSGTNGKTTTTALIVRAAVADGQSVVSNTAGANLLGGIYSTLLERRSAELAVLEVDEMVLPAVIALTRPTVVALLNLSRDQLDRAHEVSRIAELWHDGLAGHPELVVVANADEPLIVWAVRDCQDVAWVGAGRAWEGDAVACPACSSRIDVVDGRWGCTGCGLRRPVTDPAEGIVPSTGMPGRCNVANAAMASAVLDELGLSCGTSSWLGLTSVAGRYAEAVVHDKKVRLLLAKNPAGWLETLDLLDADRDLVFALNSRVEDGVDSSWIWDVPFECLRGRTVVCTGERSADMAVRLNYAGAVATVEPDVERALRRWPKGPVDLVANYSAFREACGQLLTRA